MTIAINLKQRVESLLKKIPIDSSALQLVEQAHTIIVKDDNLTFIKECRILNNLSQSLKNHAWITEVKDFINESDYLLKENNNYIKVLLVSEQLKNGRNASFYKDCIPVLENLAKTELTANDVQTISKFNWISDVRNLYSYLIESVNGIDSGNANFKISSLISPILPISESEYQIYSNGKVLKINNNRFSIVESTNTDLNFNNLIDCVEEFKITKAETITGIREKKVVIDLENSKIIIEGSEIENSKIPNILSNALGIISVGERKKIILLESLSNNFNNFVEIKEAVKIHPTKLDGVSYTIFNFGGKLYGQFVNPQMKENSLSVFEGAISILKDIKDKINFDASPVVSDLLKKETRLSEITNDIQKTLQLKIARLQDKKINFINIATDEDLFTEPKIQEAISLIDDEILALKAKFTRIDEKVKVSLKGDFRGNKGVCFLSELINENNIKVFIEGSVSTVVSRQNLIVL